MSGRSGEEGQIETDAVVEISVSTMQYQNSFLKGWGMRLIEAGTWEQLITLFVHFKWQIYKIVQDFNSFITVILKQTLEDVSHPVDNLVKI